jgi:hypothetical protein
MAKIFHILLLLTTLSTFLGCKKEDTARNNDVGGNSSTVIKYEVISTANIATPPSGIYSYVLYTGSDGNAKEERNVMNSKTWSKTITFSIPDRPIGIGFSGQIWTSGPGTITSRIYINNVLRDTRINQIVNSGSFYGAFWGNTYTLYQ